MTVIPDQVQYNEKTLLEKNSKFTWSRFNNLKFLCAEVLFRRKNLEYFLFFSWIFYLFTFQMLSPFPVSPLETPILCSLLPLFLWGCFPPPASPLWLSPTLGHRAFTRPRAAPTIDVWQGHLLHMWLKPWVRPCVLFGWWFSPRELWGQGGVWLVDIVVISMGCKPLQLLLSFL